MINASELRIGSCYKATDGTLFQWTLEYFDDWMQVDLGSFHPIPITHEVLHKCGFSNLYPTKEWILTPVMLAEREDGFVSIAEYNIKHLHQLQNLYFALTGTELNYQP